ncbi:MAG: type VI secretion system baseplate subunit TssE [Pseudomonadota bacterium]
MTQKEIRPSILDRLLHEERLDQAHSYYSMHELRESVQADLQHLLNTRVRFISPDAEKDDAQDTLLNYGLLDITSQTLVSEQGRREFAEWIERTIRRFEPRFKNVKVTVGERSPRGHKAPLGGFVFRVNAVLYADPAPENVSFDSRIDPGNQTIVVKEAHR